MKKFRNTLVVLSILCTIITQAQEAYIGQGVTSPDDWQDYTSLGIYVDVDTSGCEFKTTPHYLITIESLEELGYHWGLSGAPAIYKPTPTGFRVYLRWTDHSTEEPTIGSLAFANPLRATTAKNRQWVIRWTGIEKRDCPVKKQVAEEKDIEELIIYPNPSNDQITIKSIKEIVKYEVYDQKLNLILTTTNDIINVENFNKGHYILKAFTKDGTIIKRFIK